MTNDAEHRELDLVALLGASEAEVPVLAELHRNPRVHIVGIYDPQPEAVGHELAEILGLPHGHDESFLEQILAAEQVVLPRHRNRLKAVIDRVHAQGCRVLNQDEALALYAHPQVQRETRRARLERTTTDDLGALEASLRWLEQALDREALLRSLLSIAIQAAGADRGSVQLFDAFSQQLFIAYAEGLSDHTVRTTRQGLGEGIAGRVALERRAELIRGNERGRTDTDRPDIQSAICVPLVEGDQLLGVLNVSTETGGRRLEMGDLERLSRVAERVSPVLARLLEVQATLDRTLVEDLERELDRLLALEGPTLESLALVRDLVLDLSGAQRIDLILLTHDGPALRLLEERDESGRAQAVRDVDARAGILGQVLIDGNPVVLEEKIRPAGQTEIRRRLTLYVPLGGRDSFALLVLHFEALATLSHFQRNLDRLRDVLTPRAHQLLRRHADRTRNTYLRRLASGLAEIATHPSSERAGAVAHLMVELSGATAVGVWTNDEEIPTAEVVRNVPPVDQEVWKRLRARLSAESPCRVREMDDDGSELRSLLLAGDRDGVALVAFNRIDADPLAEIGFRDDDLEAANLLLEALRAPEGDGPRAPAQGSAPDISTPTADPRTRLLDAIGVELRRAQRYHFGFSLSLFEMHPEAGDEIAPQLQLEVEHGARATDLRVWLDPLRLVVLAPEEARGQRHLVRRLQELLDAAMQGQGGGSLHVRSVSYPRDGDRPESLLRALEGVPAAGGD